MLFMTRIIGGLVGSIKLASPAKSTRPTSDRIRESIFSRLEARNAVEATTVADLYAGTGALALEAISRGAAEAVLVERDGKAAAVCVANTYTVQKALGKQGIDVATKVVNKSVKQFLLENQVKLDLVFIDPPYEISNEEVSENLGALLPTLNKDATVIVERSSRDPQPELPAGYELDDAKNYGDTTVYWLSLTA
jgi:16S rRNA (guanine966-N2)-methyltransferase